VTEDEAFVRAVVAAPADEAPRLVYADWLDERCDPRGAYLRAEVAWARARPRDRRPSQDAGLLDLSFDLDPVWVARISRPPMGVCLDRLRFVRPGPALTQVDIRAFGDRNGTCVPVALAALLLNHNGGTPSRRRLSGPFRQWLGSFRMLVPLAWSPEAATGVYPVPLAEVLSDPTRGGGQVIEIADDGETGGYFIGVASGMMGVVYYAEDSSPGNSLWETDGFLGIAPSLPELLAAIE
jgi:uncharacterized protein (TIGR02996 family)